MSSIDMTSVRHWIAFIGGIGFLMVALLSIYIAGYLFSGLFLILGSGLIMNKA